MAWGRKLKCYQRYVSFSDRPENSGAECQQSHIKKKDTADAPTAAAIEGSEELPTKSSSSNQSRTGKNNKPMNPEEMQLKIGLTNSRSSVWISLPGAGGALILSADQCKHVGFALLKFAAEIEAYQEIEEIDKMIGSEKVN